MGRAGERRVRYRVSPNLVAFWKGGHLQVLNFATKYQVRADPVVAQLLSVLGGWRSAAEAGKMIGVTHVDELGQLLERLVQASILHSSAQPPDRRDVAMAAWGPWNPAAGHFHAMTSGVTYLENDLPVAARARPRPYTLPLVKEAGARVRLTVPDTSQPFAQVLLKRRTWRQFANKDISLQSVESLLWLSAGVQAWLRTPRGERFPLTTSPSGGARHPIEVFVLAKHVRGLASGLYRYDGVRHALTTVGPPPSRTRAYLPRQHWYENSALVVFLCASFGRTLSRYKYPRAYRAVLLEAGHVCQTFCLAATSLGLAPFCTMALDDERIDADLGLDGITSGVVYAAGAGALTTTRVPSAPARQRKISIEKHTPSRRK
jgi:SagB-type dehydrogenase family enzyme